MSNFTLVGDLRPLALVMIGSGCEGAAEMPYGSVEEGGFDVVQGRVRVPRGRDVSQFSSVAIQCKFPISVLILLG